MTLIRKIAVFCAVITMFSCSGLRKNDKNPKETLVEISTNYGKMLIELSDKTPKHKTNFIKLAKESFYDSTLFHRVMKGFMIQGGDPESKGAPLSKVLGNGGPGYTVPAEFDSTLYHRKGALAAARTPDNVNPKKASSGSQFYIVQGRTWDVKQLKNIERGKQRSNPNFKYSQEQLTVYSSIGGFAPLDGEYTVFGQVIRGIEVVDKIANVVTRNRRKEDRPTSDVIMSMKVIEVSAKQKMKLLEK